MVARIVSEPAPSSLRAAPKKRRGISIARESRPPDIVRDPVANWLYTRAKRVSESSRMKTSSPSTTFCSAILNRSSAIFLCCW